MSRYTALLVQRVHVTLQKLHMLLIVTAAMLCRLQLGLVYRVLFVTVVAGSGDVQRSSQLLKECRLAEMHQARDTLCCHYSLPLSQICCLKDEHPTKVPVSAEPYRCVEHTVKASSQMLCTQVPQAAAREPCFKGVHWVASKGQWEARVECEGGVKVVGLYKEAREAAMAHDAAVLVAGTDAPLNFPNEVSAYHVYMLCVHSSIGMPGPDCNGMHKPPLLVLQSTSTHGQFTSQWRRN